MTASQRHVNSCNMTLYRIQSLPKTTKKIAYCPANYVRMTIADSTSFFRCANSLLSIVAFCVFFVKPTQVGFLTKRRVVHSQLLRFFFFCVVIVLIPLQFWATSHFSDSLSCLDSLPYRGHYHDSVFRSLLSFFPLSFFFFCTASVFFFCVLFSLRFFWN